MTALIIDDEIDICNLLSSLLIRQNIETHFVNFISTAVAAIEKYKPELIFLDNRLSDGRGIDFVEYIKENFPMAKLVMMTAYDTDADKNLALSKGVDYFISKPFSREKIYQIIQELINLK